MSEQMTRDEAIAFLEGGQWRDWDLEKKFWFQWNQDRLCIPWGQFHEAAEHVLGRRVWTHEFADRGRLQRELESGIKPTFSEIVALLPEEKTIVIKV